MVDPEQPAPETPEPAAETAEHAAVRVRGQFTPVPASALEPRPEPPLQFTIRTLLVLQVVCAVFFGLLTMIGLFAVLILYIATLIFAAVRVRPEHWLLKRTAIDLLGGVVLPMMCFVFDPFVVRGGFGGWSTAGGPHEPMYAYLYTAVMLQIVAFLAWQFGGRWMSPAVRAMVAGMLWVGVFIAVGVGVAMLPVTLIGLIVFGIGAVGSIPFLTFAVFLRSAQAAGRNCGARPPVFMGLLGAALGLLLPLLIYPLAGPLIIDALRAIPTGHSRFLNLW